MSYVVGPSPNPNRNNPKYNSPTPRNMKPPYPPCNYDHRGAALDYVKDKDDKYITHLVCVYCKAVVGCLDDTPKGKRNYITYENRAEYV